MPLGMALHNHATLKRLTRLQLLPPINRTDLHTNHVLVSVLRLEVTHALRLLDPGIPDDAVFKIVADDVQARLAVLEDRCRGLLDRLVDAVSFAGNRE